MAPRRPIVRRFLLAAPLVVVAAFFVATPALAESGTGINPLLPDAKSPNGKNLYDLYLWQITPFALFIFLLVESLLLVIIIKFRRKRLPPGYVPPQWHGNNRLEMLWTLVPFLILCFIGAFSFLELQRDFVKPTDAQTDIDITITAHQFGWTYDYPDGFQVASEGLSVKPMVIPVNKLVRLRLRSIDVIHGWWIPELMGKTDLVPGYDNFTWIKPTQEGEWRGQCTELCGSGHGTMLLRVQAVSQSGYATFVNEEKAKARPSPSGRPSAPASPGTTSPSPAARPSASPST